MAVLISAVAVVALVLSSPQPVSGQVTSVIDLTAPPEEGGCRTCHAVLTDSSRPHVIFSHGAHLLVTCSACHHGVAHQDGVTRRTTMEECFACHGVSHGPQGVLATGECRDCHPASFELRPPDHSKDWAKKPHAKSAETDQNRCLMCHEAEPDCDTCHEDLGLDIEPIPNIYNTVLEKEPDLPSMLVDTEATVAAGSCNFCHPNIDDFKVEGLVFTHEPHLKRDYDCVACHETFPHGPDRTERPPMLSCYRCHSLEHSEQGEVGTEDCLACHTKTFELMPEDHTRKFLLGEHNKEAYDRMTECTMCHASSECQPCHTGGVKMLDGKISQPVIPQDHRTPDWQPGHGDQYLGQKGACSICHKDTFCADCHVTPMPHPSTWIGDHSSGGLTVNDCDVCHADKSDCQDCHHKGLDQAELIAENCVDCHEVMKNPKPTTIKNVPLAEHAVHFNVEESKGRPYVCPDCHIGFSATSVMEPATDTQVHDLRICYDCHGNLDTENKLIAPYPGKELCYQCHVDLRL